MVNFEQVPASEKMSFTCSCVGVCHRENPESLCSYLLFIYFVNISFRRFCKYARVL